MYVIHAEPFQQERVRASVSKMGKKSIVKMYDPPRSKQYKKVIQQQVLSQSPSIMEGNLKLQVTFYVKIPKSYSKKQRKAIEEGLLLPNKKPDLSNYIKILEDALNGICYKDDSQIVEIHAQKQYSDNPRTEFSITTL